jgi:hypothetical protein
MNAKPGPSPDPADDDGTGNDGTAEPTILGPAEYLAKSLNGEIDPAEWDEI